MSGRKKEIEFRYEREKYKRKKNVGVMNNFAINNKK